jgi:hypothetical protein
MFGPLKLFLVIGSFIIIFKRKSSVNGAVLVEICEKAVHGKKYCVSLKAITSENAPLLAAGLRS